jgi:DNA-binding response OmpR family regulator
MAKFILLIEDDTAIIDVYKTALEANGFKVEVITMGKDAFEKVERLEKGEEKNPDLVLLDLILPDVNGIEILEAIRKKTATKDIPVYILTNYSDPELEKLGNKLKAEKYVLKTECTPKKLVDMIKERLGGN